MKKILALLVVLILSTPLLAQDDSTAVNMAQVMDKLGNRALDGLEELAGQMGITAEKAFPYAVQYVEAKREVNTKYMKYITFCLWGGMLFCIGFLVLSISQNWDDFGVGFSGTATILLFVASTITLIAWISRYADLIVFRIAPEAATVEYLINMVR